MKKERAWNSNLYKAKEDFSEKEILFFRYVAPLKTLGVPLPRLGIEDKRIRLSMNSGRDKTVT
jgi:hypothetical protein